MVLLILGGRAFSQLLHSALRTLQWLRYLDENAKIRPHLKIPPCQVGWAKRRFSLKENIFQPNTVLWLETIFSGPNYFVFLKKQPLSLYYHIFSTYTDWWLAVWSMITDQSHSDDGANKPLLALPEVVLALLGVANPYCTPRGCQLDDAHQTFHRLLSFVTLS